MSKKGEKKSTKTLNAPKAVHIHRKENTWTIKTKAGAHKRNESVALGIVLRNFIGIARTLKEAKNMLIAGEIKVNGVVRKDYQLGVGLFDIIDIEKQKVAYRAMIDDKGRIIVNEMKKPSKEKLCKVVHKRATSKGIQLTTNDGRTLIGGKAKVGDTLKIKVPEGKIEEVIALKEGSLVYMTKGVHCAEKGKVIEILPGTAKRKKLVKIEKDGKEYGTIAENVFVIGDKKEALGEIN